MKKKPSDINYLDLTPCALVEHQILENGRITLLIPRFSSKIGRLLFNPPASRRYIYLNLDELGSATWLLINSERKVGEICNTLSETLGEKIHPVDQRVTKFLSQLFRNKYISFKEL